MKTALVCIAKDEDNYIDEWINYHLKLGFNDIFIYQNNWRYKNNNKYGNNVHFIEFDGEAMQLIAYNDFISKNFNAYDFGAFIDCDEFICFTVKPNINEFLKTYSDLYGIALNWKCFGDNGRKSVNDGEYSVLKRFTLCGKSPDRHVKTILNFKMCKDKFKFINPHFVDMSLRYDVISDPDRTSYIHGPWNYASSNPCAWINHYHCKTIQEFRQKILRGKADTPKCHPLYHHTEASFAEHNTNDIENLNAVKFMYGKNFKL